MKLNPRLQDHYDITTAVRGPDHQSRGSNTWKLMVTIPLRNIIDANFFVIKDSNLHSKRAKDFWRSLLSYERRAAKRFAQSLASNHVLVS